MIDCLIIGPNDVDFEQHLKTLRLAFGRKSGAFQDQDLTFVTHRGKPYRALDLLNMINADKVDRPLTNTDFLWPTILVLGSYLNKHGFTFDYINEFTLERADLRRKLRENAYRLVAITTTLYVTDAPIKDIIAEIRSVDLDVLVIVGGPYIKNRLVGNDPADIDREFDGLGADIYVNSSEGQHALVEVLKALRRGGALRSIPNLIYRNRLDDVPGDEEADARSAVTPAFSFTRPETEYMPLDDNPIRYELFPEDHIGRFVSLATAKSCPYACAFCGFPSRAGAYTYLDVDAVERELDRIKALNVSTLTFLDDTFNVPKKRFKELLRMMIRKQYHFKWNSFYRSDQGDDETIALMAESGCEGVFLGIESASDEMLKTMNKTSRRKHYEAAIPVLKKAGIYTHANFIVGFPGETENTARETMNFIQEFQPSTYKSQLWYADNTSPIWKRREEFGIEGIGFSWSHSTMDSQRASELVDEMVQVIDRSVFLPQDGFGMWCIFYLQRHGMSRERVLEFLRLFGAEVKRKRAYPEHQEISETALARLYEVGRIPEMRPEPMLAHAH